MGCATSKDLAVVPLSHVRRSTRGNYTLLANYSSTNATLIGGTTGTAAQQRNANITITVQRVDQDDLTDRVKDIAQRLRWLQERAGTGASNVNVTTTLLLKALKSEQEWSETQKELREQITSYKSYTEKVVEKITETRSRENIVTRLTEKHDEKDGADSKHHILNVYLQTERDLVLQMEKDRHSELGVSGGVDIPTHNDGSDVMSRLKSLLGGGQGDNIDGQMRQLLEEYNRRKMLAMGIRDLDRMKKHGDLKRRLEDERKRRLKERKDAISRTQEVGTNGCAEDLRDHCLNRDTTEYLEDLDTELKRADLNVLMRLADNRDALTAEVMSSIVDDFMDEQRKTMKDADDERKDEFKDIKEGEEDEDMDDDATETVWQNAADEELKNVGKLLLDQITSSEFTEAQLEELFEQHRLQQRHLAETIDKARQEKRVQLIKTSAEKEQNEENNNEVDVGDGNTPRGINEHVKDVTDALSRLSENLMSLFTSWKSSDGQGDKGDEDQEEGEDVEKDGAEKLMQIMSEHRNQLADLESQRTDEVLGELTEHDEHDEQLDGDIGYKSSVNEDIEELTTKLHDALSTDDYQESLGIAQDLLRDHVQRQEELVRRMDGERMMRRERILAALRERAKAKAKHDDRDESIDMTLLDGFDDGSGFIFDSADFVYSVENDIKGISREFTEKCLKRRGQCDLPSDDDSFINEFSESHENKIDELERNREDRIKELTSQLQDCSPTGEDEIKVTLNDEIELNNALLRKQLDVDAESELDGAHVAALLSEHARRQEEIIRRREATRGQQKKDLENRLTNRCDNDEIRPYENGENENFDQSDGNTIASNKSTSDDEEFVILENVTAKEIADTQDRNELNAESMRRILEDHNKRRRELVERKENDRKRYLEELASRVDEKTAKKRDEEQAILDRNQAKMQKKSLAVMKCEETKRSAENLVDTHKEAIRAMAAGREATRMLVETRKEQQRHEAELKGKNRLYGSSTSDLRQTDQDVTPGVGVRLENVNHIPGND